MVVEEVALVIAGMKAFKAAVDAVKLAQQLGGEERSRRLIDEARNKDLDEMWTEFQLVKRLVSEHSEALKEALASPDVIAKAAAELSDAQFGASPTKKRALRRLTLRRFDSSVPRDLRELWFNRARDLKDHEIHGLLCLGNSGVTFREADPGKAWPRYVEELLASVQEPPVGLAGRLLRATQTLDTLGWSRGDVEQHASVFFYLAQDHPDLVQAREVEGFIGYRLGQQGRRLVDAMTAYDAELGGPAPEARKAPESE